MNFTCYSVCVLHRILALLQLIFAKQQHNIQNITSLLFYCKITSGVPRGSKLKPLLFLLFINNLPEHIGCEILLFVDDIKIFQFC